MNVRHAELGNLEQILELAKRFCEKVGVPGFPYDFVTCYQLGQSLIAGDNGCLFLARDDEEKVVGMLGGGLHGCLTSSREIHATELFWWVDPEHRGSRAGSMLLEAFEEWARERGARYVKMSALANDMANGVENFYSTHGFKPVERVFCKEL